MTTVGERAIYEDPVFSPDRTRLAVNKEDLAVWSPDGSQVAYAALRGGYEGLYRKASNGEGTEELLYQHPGAGMFLRDWSLDGRFLSFSTTDLSGGTLYALPLAGVGERKPIQVFRSESQMQGSRLSPDSRFLSYVSDQSGKNEVYVRPFDPSAGAGGLQRRRGHGRCPTKVARARPSGGRTARKCTMWPPIEE